MHVSAERRVCTIPCEQAFKVSLSPKYGSGYVWMGGAGGGGGGSGLFVSSFPQVGVSILNTM